MRKAIIPIFIPHLGCPHQCVFCNQQKITGVMTTINQSDVYKIITDALLTNSQTNLEVAFYGGSFTALPTEVQIQLLQPASDMLSSGKINGIRLSTRPDYIDVATIRTLRKMGVSIIELGAQSLDDHVLLQAERGHSYEQIAHAVRLIKSASMECGLQLMVGLPGEDWGSLIRSAQKTVKLQPDFVRIYPTIVIAGTTLASLYAQHSYTPLTLEEAISRAAYLKLFIEYWNGIKIIRTGLQASEFLEQPGVLIAGPYHPSIGEMVEAHIFYLMMRHVLDEYTDTHVVIRHNSKDHSKIRGIRNSNLKKLKQRYEKIERFQLTPENLREGHLSLSIGKRHYMMNKEMIFHI
jgi:histone acetyltransferase (RNA polymerase elongator complex component)